MNSILDDPRIGNAYFFPRDDSPENVTMVDVDGGRIACHVTINDPESLTLLHFHGNGETIASYATGEYHNFFNIGVNVVFVEYRGYGQSSGTPQFTTMLGDGEAVIRQLGLSPDRVVAFGRSLGSLYAIELAARQPSLAGLVIESGIYDLAERLTLRIDGQEISHALIRAECERHFNHDAKLEVYANPLLVLHAENDRLISTDHAKKNYFAAASSDKKQVILPNGDHNSIMLFNANEYFAELQQFLRRVEAT